MACCQSNGYQFFHAENRRLWLNTVIWVRLFGRIEKHWADMQGKRQDDTCVKNIRMACLWVTFWEGTSPCSRWGIPNKSWTYDTYFFSQAITLAVRICQFLHRFRPDAGCYGSAILFGNNNLPVCMASMPSASFVSHCSAASKGRKLSWAGH